MPKHKNAALFKHIGFKIRIKRRELKFSQEKLAEMLNVAYTQIYSYETGKFKIPLDYLLSLAEIFKVDLNYFISDFNTGKKEAQNKKDTELENLVYKVKEIYNLKDESLNFGLEKCIESIYAVAVKKALK